MTIRLLSKINRQTAAAFFLFLFFLLFTSTQLPAQQTEETTPTKSCLWEVKNGSTRVFLLGSLHVLKSSAYPLAEEINNAYTASKRLVFETDIGAMMEPAVLTKMMELGLYPEGQDLFQNISGTTRRSLEKKLQDLGLPAATFARFKPWFMAMTLTTLELQRLGFNPQYGIDLHFYTKAKADNKTLAYLEPVEYQLNLLGKMDSRDQKSFLNQTLKDLANSAVLADQMMAAWQSGEADDLYTLLFKSFEDHPGIEDRLLTRRNKEWIDRIEDMLQEPQATMVIVGAGHLVGPEGLVELLKEDGYEVKQK
ncbi:hypothetical protein D1AOALGA4SA_3594 [Olavius algarvensis Delta 1 endosymbiont]|nr:hypothetical protein D1AOALGA4SA_3594 [Olavius algarvensis Delta 1 endosymbiont]